MYPSLPYVYHLTSCFKPMVQVNTIPSTMQTIRIGSTDTLVFFYRGSNTHIIKSSVAVEENLQCISANPTELSVVGGSKVRTGYGTYWFNLGSTESGEYIMS